MKPIVTLTVNPAIDASCVADEVIPMRKVRTRDERYDPGGGGLNVARVVRELGGEALVRARRWFTSFGCCGVTDPWDDLVALGLVTG